jgi:integrase
MANVNANCVGAERHVVTVQGIVSVLNVNRLEISVCQKKLSVKREPMAKLSATTNGVQPIPNYVRNAVKRAAIRRGITLITLIDHIGNHKLRHTSRTMPRRMPRRTSTRMETTKQPRNDKYYLWMIFTMRYLLASV